MVDKLTIFVTGFLIAAAIAVGGSMVIASCENQDGGYPTPQVHVDVDHPKAKKPKAKAPKAPSVPKQRTRSGAR